MAGGGGEQDLNLVPYMDIIVTLILAMVFTVAQLQDFSTAKVDVPPFDGKGATGQPLTVVLGGEGFEVRQGGAVLALPKEDGDWPYAKLAGVLRGVKDGGGEPKLTLSPEAAVPYKVVVTTLDAMRKDDAGLLYPDVALALAKR